MKRYAQKLNVYEDTEVLRRELAIYSSLQFNSLNVTVFKKNNKTRNHADSLCLAILENLAACYS